MGFARTGLKCRWPFLPFLPYFFSPVPPLWSTLRVDFPPRSVFVLQISIKPLCFREFKRVCVRQPYFPSVDCIRQPWVTATASADPQAGPADRRSRAEAWEVAGLVGVPRSRWRSGGRRIRDNRSVGAFLYVTGSSASRGIRALAPAPVRGVRGIFRGPLLFWGGTGRSSVPVADAARGCATAGAG